MPVRVSYEDQTAVNATIRAIIWMETNGICAVSAQSNATGNLLGTQQLYYGCPTNAEWVLRGVNAYELRSGVTVSVKTCTDNPDRYLAQNECFAGRGMPVPPGIGPPYIPPPIYGPPGRTCPNTQEGDCFIDTQCLNARATLQMTRGRLEGICGRIRDARTRADVAEAVGLALVAAWLLTLALIAAVGFNPFAVFVLVFLSVVLHALAAVYGLAAQAARREANSLDNEARSAQADFDRDRAAAMSACTCVLCPLPGAERQRPGVCGGVGSWPPPGIFVPTELQYGGYQG